MPLVACPDCRVHCRSDESTCPHCGAALRDGDGRVAPTAAALMLGLAVGVVGCDSDSGPNEGVPAYGVSSVSPPVPRLVDSTGPAPAYGVSATADVKPPAPPDGSSATPRDKPQPAPSTRPSATKIDPFTGLPVK